MDRIQTCVVGADHLGVNRRRCSKQGSSTGQATVFGKMILVSAQDRMKRTGRCRDMHDVETLQDSWREGSREWTSQGVSAKKHFNGLWRRMPCTMSRLHDQYTRQKIHRKGSKASSHVQVSCARSTHEDEGYLQTVTSKKYGSCRQK